MNDHDSRTLKSPQTADAPTTIDRRDADALTRTMTVLDDVDAGDDELPAVAGARDRYLVVSDSGREYVVDARRGRCSCPDHEYRNTRCIHLRRVAFATGERELPNWADDDAVDDALGQHVQRVATDGGTIDDDQRDPVVDGIETDLSETPTLDEGETATIEVTLDGVHLSTVSDGVIHPAKSDLDAGEYEPIGAISRAVERAVERHDLAVAAYRHATIDVPIDEIVDDEFQISPYIVTITFTVDVERFLDAHGPRADGGTIATDAGASTPTSSTSETETDDAGEQLPDGVDTADVAVADTGAGLLVFEVEREYRDFLDRDVEVARELIGFSDVGDWDAIDEAVRARGHEHGDVLHLPEFDVDALPDPVGGGNGGDDR